MDQEDNGWAFLLFKNSDHHRLPMSLIGSQCGLKLLVQIILMSYDGLIKVSSETPFWFEKNLNFWLL